MICFARFTQSPRKTNNTTCHEMDRSKLVRAQFSISETEMSATLIMHAPVHVLRTLPLAMYASTRQANLEGQAYPVTGPARQRMHVLPWLYSPETNKPLGFFHLSTQTDRQAGRRPAGCVGWRPLATWWGATSRVSAPDRCTRWAPNKPDAEPFVLSNAPLPRTDGRGPSSSESRCCWGTVSK